jgi:hypothetical protein
MFTDDLIKHLIECPKIITEPPKDAGIGRGSRKVKFQMKSEDGGYDFRGFISQNLTFDENFSIGLVFYPIGQRENYVLLRVNGPHGWTKDHPHHVVHHIHFATAARINAGLRPEGRIEVTTEYTAIADAIQFYNKN